MANTVRTVSELLDIFADNTSQDISPQDMRDFVVSTKLDDTVVLDDLADVAFSGSYNDLTDLPDIVLTVTPNRAVVSDGDGVVTASTTTATEIGYVNGVTSAIQTQLNAKQATITGGATSITSSDLTASRALASDGSGKVAVSTVTSTELGYVSGVTSAIQTQLGTKVTGAATDFVAISNATAARNKIQPSANVVPLTTKQSSGGSANLLECQADDNTVKASVDNLGQVYAAYGYGINGGRIIEDNGTISVRNTSGNFIANAQASLKFSTTNDAYNGITCDVGIKRSGTNELKVTDGSTGTGNVVAGNITTTASSSSATALTVKGASSQSANLLEVKNSSDTVLAYIRADGSANFAQGVGINRSGGSGYDLGLGGNGLYSQGQNLLEPYTGSLIPLMIKGASGQSANLLELKDSSNTLLASVTPAGAGDFTALTVASKTVARIYRTSFSNPSTDTLTVTHSLGNQYVQVTVYDENNKQILVDEVTATSTSVATLDKTSYGTVTGTWNVVVVG